MARINIKNGTVTHPDTSGIAWSTQQQNIFNCVATTSENIAIKARAGSGKTTTLVEGMRRLPNTTGSTLFAAFNRDIVKELETKVPATVDCKTMHSLGMQCVKANSKKYVKVSAWKTVNIFKSMLNMDDETESAFFWEYRKPFTKIVSNIKNAMLTADEVTEELVASMLEVQMPWIEITNHKVKLLLTLAKRSLEPDMHERSMTIDFDDMLYLPVMNNWIPYMYDCVFLDEAQDLNAIQHVMVNRILKPGGRLILAGDPQQSIYGFKGAEANGMEALTNAHLCTELPLSISYRCKPAIIKEANIFVTDIESADYLKGGHVEIINLHQLVDKVNTNSMILCRYNAPLVNICLSLLASGKSATILGNDIHSHVIGFAKQIKRAMGQITPLKVEDWCELKIATAKDKWAVERIEDLKEILLAILSSDICVGTTDVIPLINEVFKEKRNCIQLSTVHKVKGQEADRVFIIGPETVPSRFASSPYEIEQEYNLLYVAITRAKSELYYVTEQKEWSWR